VVRNRRFDRRPPVSAPPGLPVRGIHARHDHTDADLAVFGFGNRSLDELEDRGITMRFVDDRLHPSSIGIS
jgi:hypothetical protein